MTQVTHLHVHKKRAFALREIDQVNARCALIHGAQPLLEASQIFAHLPQLANVYQHSFDTIWHGYVNSADVGAQYKSFAS
jgi:hypothetical protein